MISALTYPIASISRHEASSIQEALTATARTTQADVTAFEPWGRRLEPDGVIDAAVGACGSLSWAA